MSDSKAREWDGGAETLLTDGEREASRVTRALLKRSEELVERSAQASRRRGFLPSDAPPPTPPRNPD